MLWEVGLNARSTPQMRKSPAKTRRSQEPKNKDPPASQTRSRAKTGARAVGDRALKDYNNAHRPRGTAETYARAVAGCGALGPTVQVASLGAEAAEAYIHLYGDGCKALDSIVDQTAANLRAKGWSEDQIVEHVRRMYDGFQGVDP